MSQETVSENADGYLRQENKQRGDHAPNINGQPLMYGGIHLLVGFYCVATNESPENKGATMQPCWP
eukprot:1860964-Amphidinium_carterae.1